MLPSARLCLPPPLPACACLPHALPCAPRWRSKEAPINHGPCAADGLLEAAARVVRANFIERGGASLNFNLIALAPADG